MNTPHSVSLLSKPTQVAAKTVAIYYRVSSNKQSTECQKPDVAALLQHHNLQASLVYEEKASAAKHRPQFAQLLEDARHGRFQILVVWALDRFGRSMAGNLTDLLALDKAGVTVLSVKEPWLDTRGPIRELLIAIFSWVAEQERARLIERTNAGIAHAKASGKRWGNAAHDLLPPSLRGPIIEQWMAEGRPDGFVGLAAILGCKSTATSHRLYKEWEADLKAR